ncbi:hypothetical protein [Streptomyces sp. TUS-ST3]|uniref:hypothetical protein n=1 Tax=Streptomyces sp. TUS-ST3 TaxID=3025591 RepID=UPI0024E05D22|nr:hypothetical protein [Streptomyces sp. TUS-ST3]
MKRFSNGEGDACRHVLIENPVNLHTVHRWGEAEVERGRGCAVARLLRVGATAKSVKEQPCSVSGLRRR